MGNFAVQRSDGDGVRLIEVSGELDMVTVPDLREALDGYTDFERVVVDTSRLSFMDSNGLHVLIEARDRIGQRLELVSGKATDRLLELAGLRDYFGLG